MKLFVIAPYLGRVGGAPNYLYPLLKHLTDVSTFVYVPSGCGDAGSMGPDFDALPNVEVKSGGDTEMEKLFGEFNPDALLCWEVDPHKCGCGGTRVVSIVHGLGVAYPESDMIVCATENVRRSMRKERPDLIDKLVVINGTVEEGVPNEDLREVYHIPEGRRVVGFVGRFVPEKNPIALIEASAGQDWTVLMVGDGPQKQMLMQLAQDIGADAIFTGEMANVWSAYAAMDLLCLPSLVEEFAQVSMEAALAEVPMVMTPVGSNTEIFNTNHVFFANIFFANTDQIQIRNRINEAFERPHDASSRARNAKRMIMERCNIAAFVSKWREALFPEGDQTN